MTSRSLIVKAAILLLILVNTININAALKQIVFVNATTQPLRLFLHYGSSFPDKTGQPMQPGEAYIRANPEGYDFITLDVDIAEQRLPTKNLDSYGLYVISGHDRSSYQIQGPYQDRALAGTLFLVNATGLGMQYYVDYHSLFCAHDHGDMVPGQVITLKIAGCLTSELYGYNIAIGGGLPNKTTNKYTGSTGNGAFVFRKKAGTDAEFEVAGPFKFSY